MEKREYIKKGGKNEQQQNIQTERTKDAKKGNAVQKEFVSFLTDGPPREKEEKKKILVCTFLLADTRLIPCFSFRFLNKMLKGF